MTMIGQHIGSYKIVRILGEGGMGEVFEAVHEKLHRRAAIKVLHPHVARAPEMAARFRNEARAVNIIRHPGVVDIYEHGQLPDGTVYLVMEYLEGRSLRETLDQEVLTEAQAILLSQQLASALAAAHGKGIIHRGQLMRPFSVEKWGIYKSGWKRRRKKAVQAALRWERMNAPRSLRRARRVHQLVCNPLAHRVQTLRCLEGPTNGCGRTHRRPTGGIWLIPQGSRSGRYGPGSGLSP